jgi:hypothetical protein
VRVAIVGTDLPGRRWHEGAEVRENVHVGVQVRAEPVDLVPGDAPSARWTVEVRVHDDDDGCLDFGGPAVHGRRGERFLYLTWGDVGEDGSFEMFRRAKLMLDEVDAGLVRAAQRGGTALTARVHLTDDCGGPRCARLRSPVITWAVEPPARE